MSPASFTLQCQWMDGKRFAGRLLCIARTTGLLCLFVGPPCAAVGAPQAVSLTVRGPNAPAFAAETIAALVKADPADLITKDRTSDQVKSVDGRCGNAAPRQGCYGWDALVDSGTWPTEVPQIEALKNALRIPGHTNSYYLPRVTTSVLTSIVTVSKKVGTADAPTDSLQSLCRPFRWSEADASNCVLEVLSAADSQRGAPNSRDVVIRRRVLNMSFDVSPDRQPAFRASAAVVIARLQAKYPLTKAFFDEPPQKAEALIAQTPSGPPPAACPAAQLRESASRARNSISWPDTQPSDTIAPQSLTILETNDDAIHGTVGKNQLWISSDAVLAPKYSAEAVQVVDHPMLQQSPIWSPNCAIYSSVSPNLQFSHSVAIASVIEGQRVRLSTTDGSSLELRPFFSPAAYNLLAYSGLVPGKLPPMPGPSVLVASYQTGAPRPAIDATMPQPLVSDYSSFLDGLLQGGNIIVAAAPHADPTVASDPRVHPGSDFPCIAWPSCLGSLGWIVTVAAMNSDDTLMTTDPADSLDYDVSQREIQVAAAGGDLPVAVTTANGSGISLQSGTSLAAPIVAALALELQRKWPRPRQAYDIVAAIQSTADVTRFFGGRIRFGVVNAQRALQIADAPDGSAILYSATADEAKDASSASAPFKLVGVAKGGDCDVADINTAMGVLYYRPKNQTMSVEENGSVEPPLCIPLKDVLRIRWTGFDEPNAIHRFVLVHQIPNGTVLQRKFAYIEREVALGPDNSCSVAGIDAPGAPPPCISIVAPDGTKKGVSLLHRDIVFNPRNRLEEKP